jgi:hypothetical protein
MLLFYIFFGVIGLFVLGLIFSALTPGESSDKAGKHRPNRHMEDTWHKFPKNQGQDLLQASHKRFMDATNKRSRDLSKKRREENDKNLGRNKF